MKLIDFLVEYEKGIYYDKIVFDNNVFEYDKTYGVYRMYTNPIDLMEYLRNKQDLSKEVIILDNVDKIYRINKINNIIPTVECIDGTRGYDNEELGNKLNELINVINEMRCR